MWYYDESDLIIAICVESEIVTKNAYRQNFVELILFVKNCILLQKNGIERFNLGVRVIYFTLCDISQYSLKIQFTRGYKLLKATTHCVENSCKNVVYWTQL